MVISIVGLHCTSCSHLDICRASSTTGTDTHKIKVRLSA